jgi:DNA-binding PadR family transcriptional regulator
MPMDALQLSLTEYAVLGLLTERPTHGFAIARELSPSGSVGRVLTVRRPLVYRALDRLVDTGLAQPLHSEPGDAGPQRVIHKATANGRRWLNRWLSQPVRHVRDLRIEFQLKMTLLDRAGKSPASLIRAQRDVLEPTFAALEEAGEVTDHLELWRNHNAAAASSYLRHLEKIHRG